MNAAEAFRRLICCDAPTLLAHVACEKDLHTDALAAMLLGRATSLYGTADPTVMSTLAEAALMACAESSDHDLLCRAWLAKAQSHMVRGHFPDAANAIDRASEHTRQIDGDDTFYRTLIEHYRVMLLYYLRRDEDAATRLRGVIVGYERCGDAERAHVAGQLIPYISGRRNDFEAALVVLEADVVQAFARRDEPEIARLQSAMADSYLHLDRVAEAEAAISIALRIARVHEMVAFETWAMRVEALIMVRRDGTLAGLRAMEQVRQRCLAQAMPGEALLCLISAVKLLARFEPTADEIAPLCQTIQVEASRLSLPVAVAEATEHLRVAALRKVVTPAMVDQLEVLIDPAATFVEEMAN